MRLRLGAVLALSVVAGGCAYSPLSVRSLDRVEGVAFISRIADDAGPKSEVFRGDSSYRPTLEPRHISDKEADRRLAQVLAQGNKANPKRGIKAARSMSRFEVADTLRAETLARLPAQHPWADAIDPVLVARALESFLVQEVPANAPDYGRLREFGADAVVEIVVEDYGMRSARGQAGVYLKGTARMFRIGGGELYHRHFEADDLRAGLDGLDPLKVARDASLYVARLKQILLGVADQVARDLNPVRAAPPAGSDAKPADRRRPTTAPDAQDDDPL